MKLFEDMIVSEADEAIVKKVTDQEMQISVGVGGAIVVVDVLKQAAVAIAKDAVESVLSGDKEQAEMLGLVGLEIINFIDKLNSAIDGIEGAKELVDIAKRSSAAAREVNNLKGETLQ